MKIQRRNIQTRRASKDTELKGTSLHISIDKTSVSRALCETGGSNSHNGMLVND